MLQIAGTVIYMRESESIKMIQSECEFNVNKCTTKYKEEAFAVHTEQSCGANTGGILDTAFS